MRPVLLPQPHMLPSRLHLSRNSVGHYMLTDIFVLQLGNALNLKHFVDHAERISLNYMRLRISLSRDPRATEGPQLRRH